MIMRKLNLLIYWAKSVQIPILLFLTNEIIEKIATYMYNTIRMWIFRDIIDI